MKLKGKWKGKSTTKVKQGKWYKLCSWFGDPLDWLSLALFIGEAASITTLV